jgi:GTPase involved in cell partitioning and DNA repair
VDSPDPQEEYELLRHEIESYSEELAEKPHCVIITKTDLLPAGEEPPRINAPDAWGQYALSAVSHRGLERCRKTCGHTCATACTKKYFDRPKTRSTDPDQQRAARSAPAALHSPYWFPPTP